MTGRTTGRRPVTAWSSKNKKLKFRNEFTSYINFLHVIVFEKEFFFNRRGGHTHSSILKFRLVFKGSPNDGRRPVVQNTEIRFYANEKQSYEHGHPYNM